MSYFGELLIKYRQRAGFTQKELGEKVGVDDSYISRLERGVYQPPTREVTLKLADALGLSGKIRRFVFFLAAYVAGYEDMEGLTLVEEGDGQSLESDKQASTTSIPSIAHPVIDTQNVLLGTTGKEIERLLGSARLSEDEEKQIAVEVIEFTKRLLALNEALRALRKSEESRQ
jgi:transcriptional regulator with XRE-family HTH domain